MPADPAVHGRCDPRFARLRDVFAAHLADGLELGASVAVCIDGVRLLDRAAVSRAIGVEASGPDRVLQLPMHWGLGYIVNAAKWLYGPNPHSFGHTGYGGSFGFADPDARLSMGYAMNRMATSLVGDPRGTALVAAVYECL